jgi:hypothetical protein
MGPAGHRPDVQYVFLRPLSSVSSRKERIRRLTGGSPHRNNLHDERKKAARMMTGC